MAKHQLPAVLATVMLLGLAATATTGADTVTLSPSKDNTLIESPNTNSNGKGDGIFAGRTATTQKLLRGLIAFDLSSIPAGATISSVELTLSMSMTTSLAQTVTLQRARLDWGEAGSVGAGGTGAPAQIGDATWLMRFYNTTPWPTPGGDFEPAVSASQSVSGLGSYKWSSAVMVADVQGWVDAPATNFGWVIRSNEGVGPTTKKFDSLQSLSPPQLKIEYSVPAGVADGAAGGAVSFAPPYPVPARGRVNLSYALPRTSRVSLSILDVSGRSVRRLVASEDVPAGRHAVVWDGRGHDGGTLASGVYVARLTVDGATFEHRIPLVR